MCICNHPLRLKLVGIYLFVTLNTTLPPLISQILSFSRARLTQPILDLIEGGEPAILKKSNFVLMYLPR